MRLTIRPLAGGCYRAEERMIDRIGSERIDFTETTSDTEMNGEMEWCNIDFRNQSLRMKQRARNFDAGGNDTRGSVSWSPRHPTLETDPYFRGYFLHADVPVFMTDETAAKQIVTDLFNATDGNCSLGGVHDHFGSSHIHFRCRDRTQPGVLDKVADTIADLVSL